jgi:hypothetical protein
MHPVTFRKKGLEASTSGLLRAGMPELMIRVEEASLLPECERFLEFVVNYVYESGRTIRPGETLNYGYWLMKFQAVNDDVLEVWEYNAEGTEFIRGGSLALRYWRDQHKVCHALGSDFKPPRPDKLTALSAGVLEGLPVQGVRYPWQEHMSGWLLVTGEWDQNIKSLKNHHTYHVTASRPDLAKFLALPAGYRFDLKEGHTVWFDEVVASQPPI